MTNHKFSASTMLESAIVDLMQTRGHCAECSIKNLLRVAIGFQAGELDGDIEAAKAHIIEMLRRELASPDASVN